MKSKAICFLMLLVTSIVTKAGVPEVSGSILSPVEPSSLIKNSWELSMLFPIAYYSNNVTLDTLGGENVNENNNVINNNINLSGLNVVKNEEPVNSEVAVISESKELKKGTFGISISPTVGGIIYATNWRYHVSNRTPTIGLIVEIPITANLSFEGQGSYGMYYVSYSGFGHNFFMGGLGGNAKLYFVRGLFNPFIEVGLMWLQYRNMTGGPDYPLYYTKNIGSGEIGIGGDLELTSNFYIGLRSSLIWPLMNRPYTLDNGLQSAPGFEEAALINTSFYRIMGSVKISF